MGNFPYNTQKFSYAEQVNGCPVQYDDVIGIAAAVRYWHGETAETDDWSQSSDSAFEDEVLIAFGLMELLSDPGAVRRLITVGKSVRKSVDRLLYSTLDQEFFVKSKEVVRPLFERENRRK